MPAARVPRWWSRSPTAVRACPRPSATGSSTGSRRSTRAPPGGPAGSGAACSSPGSSRVPREARCWSATCPPRGAAAPGSSCACPSPWGWAGSRRRPGRVRTRPTPSRWRAVSRTAGRRPPPRSDLTAGSGRRHGMLAPQALQAVTGPARGLDACGAGGSPDWRRPNRCRWAGLLWGGGALQSCGPSVPPRRMRAPMEYWRPASALVVAAHPDDIEIGCAGTVARWVAEGARVTYAVVTSDPNTRYVGDFYINHPDHRAVGEATLAAVIPGSDTRLAYPELLAEGLEPVELDAVWIMSGLDANLVVDIGDHLETKLASLRRHVTQVGDHPSAEDVAFVTGMAEQAAASQAFRFGEAFRVIRYRRPPA